MIAELMNAPASHKRPFPGMRPFEEGEADLFFGQEDQIDDLVKRLGRSRFLAVVGESGCGKSSLVKAGMIPTVLGRRPRASSFWRISVTQPGTAPIRQLAEGLAASTGGAMSAKEVEDQLRANSYGLMDFVRHSGLPAGHRVLVVIDQFEELFRLWRDAASSAERDEAELFVKLLLAVTDRSPENLAAPVYVALTMRSEYLGDCALFFGLAEAINDGAFLLPKMQRASVESAIVRPAKAFGGIVDNDLLQELLNEAEVAQQDGLPLLQHALRQLWERAERRGRPVRMTLADLRDGQDEEASVLYLEKNLNAHLNQLFQKLSPGRRPIAQALFKLLGEHDAKGRLTRVRCDLATAAAVCAVDADAVLAVADTFRDTADGQSFLTPTLERTAALRNGQEAFGICHEALLRHWEMLGSWIGQESKDAEAFRALAARAVAVDHPPALRGAELARARELRKRVLTPAWSKRYQGPYDILARRHQYDFGATKLFLARSKRAGALRKLAYAFAILIALGGTTVFARNQIAAQREADRARDLQQSAQILEAKNRELNETADDLRKAQSELTKNLTALGKSQQQLLGQITQTERARDQARERAEEADEAREQAVAAREQAVAARAQAVTLQRQAERVGEQLQEALKQLNAEKQENEAASRKRDRDQSLRILAAQEPEFVPASEQRRLVDLTSSARLYAQDYQELSSLVLAALNRSVGLSFLRASDSRPGDSALIVMPDAKVPGGLSVIRRGALPEQMSVKVNRKTWTVQRAVLVPKTNEVVVGGAGGYAALSLREAEGVTRKLHQFAISGIGFSTDGEWMATASAAGDMRLTRHDALHDATGVKERLLRAGNVTKLVTFLALHFYPGDYAVRDFALSVNQRDAKQTNRSDVSVVALTDAGRVILWRRPGPFGKLLSGVDGISVPGMFTAVATNPVTQQIWMAGGADASRPGVGVFSLTSSAFTQCDDLAKGRSISAMAWNSRGNRLALGLRNGSILLIDKASAAGCGATRQEIEIQGHGTAVTTLSWHDDVLASGASDGSARLWNMPATAADRALLATLDRLNARAESSGPQSTSDIGALQGLFNAIDARLQALRPAN